MSLGWSSSDGSMATSGSQSARSAQSRRPYGPPPSAPLPRAALQLPRVASSVVLSDSASSARLFESHREHRASRWVAQTAAAGQNPTQQVESLFWPGSHTTHNHGGHGHVSLSPLAHSPSAVCVCGAPAQLAMAQQTIASQRAELAALHRVSHTHAHAQRDLALEALQIENRELRQLKDVIRELQLKAEERQDAKAIRKRQHAAEMAAATNAFVELSAQHDALRGDFEALQITAAAAATQHGELVHAHETTRAKAEEQRLQMLAQAESLRSLQSVHTSASHELLLATSQLDSLRTNHSHLKYELEAVNGELFTLQRVRETQVAALARAAAQQAEAVSQIAALEATVCDAHALSLARAHLVESHKERHLLQEALARAQARNDTLEAVLEEYQIRQTSAWSVAEELDDDEEHMQPPQLPEAKEQEPPKDASEESEEDAPPAASSAASPTSAASRPAVVKVRRRRQTTLADSASATAATAVIAAAPSPAAASSSKKVTAPTVPPTPAAAKFGLPAGQTSLSRKLEKCLNESLRENTRLASQLYQLQLERKALQTREDAHTARARTLRAEADSLLRERTQLRAQVEDLTAKLAQTSTRCTNLVTELDDERLLSDKRAGDLRMVRGELVELRRGFSASESIAQERAQRTNDELVSLRASLASELKQRTAASERVAQLTSELTGMLSKHGVALAAKAKIMASFQQVATLNGELNVRLTIAEATAARTQALEERLHAAEHTAATADAMGKRMATENATLTRSLQGLSQQFTDLTGTHQRAAARVQAQALEITALTTAQQNAAAAAHVEAHSNSSNSSLVRALQAEVTALQERASALDTQLTEEKKLHSTRFENYRAARKESQTNKSKLFHHKAEETKLRAALEKETARAKKLEMDCLRLRAGAGLGAPSPPAMSTSPSTAQLPPHGSPLLHSSGSGATLPNLLGGGRASGLPIVPVIPVTKEDATQALLAHLTGTGAARGHANAEDDLEGSGDDDFSHPPLPRMQSLPTSPLIGGSSTAMGVMLDFSLTSNGPNGSMSTDDLARVESERRREEERRMRRRVPKRSTSSIHALDAKEEDSTAHATPARGFLNDRKQQQKKSPQQAPRSRRSSVSVGGGGGGARASSLSRSRRGSLTEGVDVSSVAAPFLDGALPTPKSLASASERLAAQSHALATIVSLSASQAAAFEVRLLAATDASDLAISAAQESSERSALLSERAAASLKTEREKNDTLLAAALKHEATIKQLTRQVAVLKAKVG